MSMVHRLGVLALVLALASIYASCNLANSRRASYKDTIERLMSRQPVTREEESSVVAAGDEAIPLIFDEMRAHPDREHCYVGENLIARMAMEKKCDPSATYVRGVLDDLGEQEVVRDAAARSLVINSGQKEIMDVLVSHARQDKSVRVRATCITGATAVFMTRAHKNKEWKDPCVVDLFTFLVQDPSSVVRAQACTSVGRICVDALSRDGIEPEWAVRLLLMSKRDPARGVRKTAITAIAETDQVRTKRRAQAGQGR